MCISLQDCFSLSLSVSHLFQWVPLSVLTPGSPGGRHWPISAENAPMRASLKPLQTRMPRNTDLGRGCTLSACEPAPARPDAPTEISCACVGFPFLGRAKGQTQLLMHQLAMKEQESELTHKPHEILSGKLPTATPSASSRGNQPPLRQPSEPEL